MRTLAATLFAIAALSLGAAYPATARAEHRTFPFAALGSYELILPQDYDPQQKYPLIVGLHGYGDTAANFGTVLSQRSGLEGVIWLFPQGPWPFESDPGKAGYAWDLFINEDTSKATSLPSVKFVADLVRHIASHYSVDPRQVYVLGHSQGGLMVYLLSQAAPDLFAGYVVFNGVCPFEPPVKGPLKAAHAPWLVMHQVGDPVVEYAKSFGAAREVFSRQGFSRVVFLDYGTAAHSLLPEMLDDFRDWLHYTLAGTQAHGGWGAGVAPSSNDPAVIGEFCDQLVRAEYANAGLDKAAVAASLATLLSEDPPSDRAIYAAGALRLPGVDERLQAIVENAAYTRELRTTAVHALRKLHTEKGDATLAALPVMLVVAGLVPGGQAAMAGIQKGDTVVSYAGEEVSSMARLSELREKHAADSAIELVVEREGKRIAVTIKGGSIGAFLDEVVR